MMGREIICNKSIFAHAVHKDRIFIFLPDAIHAE